MTAASADVLPRHRQRPEPLQRSLPQGGMRYRLAPQLHVLPGKDGGMLFSTRPLTALLLNASGVALVSGLSGAEARTVTEVAAGVPELSPLAVVGFLEDLERRRLLVREPVTPAEWPSVSIIIAAHGRPTATRACVQSLLALDYPRERIEIMVVDDASDPPLACVLTGLPVRLLRLEHNIGQSAARNLAAAEADGELLAFTDNDCVAAPRWLRGLVPYFGDPKIAIIGGRVIAPPSTGAVAAFEAVRSPLDMGSAGGPVGPREAVAYLPTCNLILRRDVLLACGGFAADMRVGEDVDFAWRVLQSGARVQYAAAGDITHDHRARLGALLRRRVDYGSSEADLQCRHPWNGRIMHLPRAGLLALAALATFPVAWPAGAALTLLATVMAMTELVSKRRRLRRIGLAVPAARLAASIIREHAASLYHLGHDVTRYYGLPLAAVGVLWPPLLPVAAVLMLVPPVCDHRRRKPALSLAAFIGLYWVEMAAYQVGVWRGCLARRCCGPLLPRLRWRG
ncbi:MAG: mycofactocin biosynthesis glycosyltransferase MftF [Hyphomicrobium sp.]